MSARWTSLAARSGPFRPLHEPRSEGPKTGEHEIGHGGESSPVKTTRSSTNSIRDLAAFRAEVEKVRWQGFAVMDEDNEIGMRAVAAPLLDSQGHAFGPWPPPFLSSASVLKPC